MAARQQNVDVLKDLQAGMVYDGPLAVMIGHRSASASELFAAAIQDYRRGVLIGNNSFGKSSMQDVVNLDKMGGGVFKDLGHLHITSGVFFRVTGKVVQREGVQPDIPIPAYLDVVHGREKMRPYALQVAPIAATEFQPSDDVNSAVITQLLQRHHVRMASSAEMMVYQAYLTYWQELYGKRRFSLNFERRQAEYNMHNAYNLQYQKQLSEAVPILASDQARYERFLRRQAASDKADEMFFVPDVMLYEALRIVHDLITLSAVSSVEAA